ncbi:DDHD domain-containing protein [Niveomyces insectorum RCEF 264]|uniref:DDHD domain-containing protein n=1 Tax=Niveomyces insectorum RCEF 264 TaxID=1081102 RepID=A0A167M912_9HYPO|nr:DDHD domain-containing protein [Niveomyces insectorum RCEF 264]
MAPPSAPGKMPEKSTLLGSMNPWAGSRSSSPKPASEPIASTSAPGLTTAKATTGTDATASSSTAPDHSTSSYYGRSFKRYPPGCPPLKVQWFHAVDVPKRKAQWFENKKPPKNTKSAKDTKPPAPPKKFVAFSVDDNRSIEASYQKQLEDLENSGSGLSMSPAWGGDMVPRSDATGSDGSADAAGSESGQDGPRYKSDDRKASVKVPVNEDFLFDVDIEQRELAPVYWLGPVYDVRRGSWFYQEGSTLRPCEENLAAQLEEGYLKVKPWQYPAPVRQGSSKDVPAKSSSEDIKGASAAAGVIAVDVTSGVDAASSSKHDNGAQNKKKDMPAASAASTAPLPPHQPESHRLFGGYMNHVATYQDAMTAWLSTDGMLSWVTSTMYERFSGGGYMSGVKVVRGYSEPKKPKDDKSKDEKRSATPTGTKLSASEEEAKRLKALKRRSAPPSTKSSTLAAGVAAAGTDAGSDWDSSTPTSIGQGEPTSEIERRGSQLQRQLSSLMSGAEARDSEAEEEDIRKREEKEIQNDYNAQNGETQGREIEHLILVTHGIGQLLGLRMESLNFIHDVNSLRKTLKSVYSSSPDLRALNSELPEGPGNCRIQVLPVCWRHLLDFPRRSDSKKQEQDLSVISEDEDEYPSLEDITIEGMAFARSLISDLALDILLYQSAYRDQIADIVLRESNRIYHLFLERNPGFKGTVHVVGHSLGSAIMFDILCRQTDKRGAKESETRRNPLQFWPSSKKDDTRFGSLGGADSRSKALSFDFDVEDFFCLGSPIGLFQMLKGRTIAARHLLKSPQSSPLGSVENPIDLEYADDTFLSAPSTTTADQRVSASTGLPFSVSSPRVGQLFNIFHPSDPISYRLEPLISPAMSSLKPQPLPYTKKGLFGSVAPQGLTGIGAKVGQSVSGLWSSFSAGIATNLLNRSLGLSQEDVAKLEQQQQQQQNQQPSQQSHHRGSSSVGGGIGGGAGSAEVGAGHANTTGPEVSAGPMDEEVETLYSHFQKKRAALAKDDAKGSDSEDMHARWKEEDVKVQRLRREEAKVRALNRNGRVDYSIQESVLDFNPINTIASHMAYWADEDVSHFMMAQVFSSKLRPAKRKQQSMAK